MCVSPLYLTCLTLTPKTNKKNKKKHSHQWRPRPKVQPPSGTFQHTLSTLLSPSLPLKFGLPTRWLPITQGIRQGDYPQPTWRRRSKRRRKRKSMRKGTIWIRKRRRRRRRRKTERTMTRTRIEGLGTRWRTLLGEWQGVRQEIRDSYGWQGKKESWRKGERDEIIPDYTDGEENNLLR